MSKLPLPNDLYDYNQYANERLLEVMAGAGVFSMFGLIGIPFAVAHPDRIGRLILWSPHVIGKPYPPSVLTTIRDSWNFYLRSSAAIVCPTDPKVVC